MEMLKKLFGGSGGSSMNAAEAKTLIEGTAAPYILDVRQPDEFKAGHVAGAHLIPLDELAGRMAELPKDKRILCVCRSGARSGTAARMLASAGYDVVNLSGGMMGWQAAGYPVKKR